MTATAPARRALPQRIVAAQRAHPEALTFSVATAVLLAHALDDALLHRQPGVGAGQHALAAALAISLGLAGVLAFPFLRSGLRAGLAFAFGSLGLVNGGLHVMHVVNDGPAHSDLSGVLAAAAGMALIGLSAAIPWRHRGEGAATRRRRWVHRAIALPAALLALLLLVVPVGVAIVETHKFRADVGAPPSPAYEDVAFRSTDGLELAGWYRPSRNGAAVLVVHGGGSDRKGSVAHAEMLVRHGYGVLLYDARGRGESEGSPNSYGWGWEKDAAGAIAFLRGRDDVDPDRIAALGLSSGADTVIDVAAGNDDLAAVVADGAALRTIEDAKRLGDGFDPFTAPALVMFKAIEVLSPDAPPRPLEDLVAQISSPTLLISAGRTVEYDYNVAYAAVAQESTEHWNLPDATHTHAIHSHAEAYEQRVVAFLDAALN